MKRANLCCRNAAQTRILAGIPVGPENERPRWGEATSQMRKLRLSVTSKKISMLVAAIMPWLDAQCCRARTPPCAPVQDSASTASATSPAPISHWAQQVVLGSSTVELTGPWKFHKGDNPEWAQPDFNDSGWAAMDLTPPPGSYDPFLGTSGFVPGWTMLGDPGYSGYAWYRLKGQYSIRSRAVGRRARNQDARRRR